jgi:DNA-directed RNA polymerase subunit H (RpoH/RPB5)
MLVMKLVPEHKELSEDTLAIILKTSELWMELSRQVLKLLGSHRIQE